MNAVLALVLLFGLHVFADFHLQGILASMKQRVWWRGQLAKNNIPEESYSFYDNDYKAALWTHAFEWTFVTYLPAFVVCVMHRDRLDMTWAYVVLLATNVLWHKVVDDGKANELVLNLITDQVMHVAQIVITWIVWSGLYGW
jgi:peptidoglycan/LPS O-acetylase OafA/YrhL